MVVTANEVKQKGVSLFDSLLAKAEEVFINVRGKEKFVVVEIERYKELRALELDRAYLDALSDIENGNAKVVTASDHINELKNAIQNSSN